MAVSRTRSVKLTVTACFCITGLKRTWAFNLRDSSAAMSVSFAALAWREMPKTTLSVTLMVNGGFTLLSGGEGVSAGAFCMTESCARAQPAEINKATAIRAILYISPVVFWFVFGSRFYAGYYDIFMRVNKAGVVVHFVPLPMDGIAAAAI